MKSANKIANECGLCSQQIRSIIVKENIIPAFIKGEYYYYDQYQEEYIHNILFFTCMVDELTFESKLNQN